MPSPNDTTNDETLENPDQPVTSCDALEGLSDDEIDAVLTVLP